MKIFNSTTKKLITKEAEEAENIIEKIVGLIGANEPKAIVIRTRFGIHTFGVKFPIDCLVLDKNKKVVSMKENLKPASFYFWNPVYDFVIELPVGRIKESKTQIGDRLKLN